MPRIEYVTWSAWLFWPGRIILTWKIKCVHLAEFLIFFRVFVNFILLTGSILQMEMTTALHGGTPKFLLAFLRVFGQFYGNLRVQNSQLYLIPTKGFQAFWFYLKHYGAWLGLSFNNHTHRCILNIPTLVSHNTKLKSFVHLDLL